MNLELALRQIVSWTYYEADLREALREIRILASQALAVTAAKNRPPTEEVLLSLNNIPLTLPTNLIKQSQEDTSWCG